VVRKPINSVSLQHRISANNTKTTLAATLAVKAVNQYNPEKNISLQLYFIMAALRSRCGHYVFALWFLASSFFFFFPRLISAVAGRKNDAKIAV